MHWYGERMKTPNMHIRLDDSDVPKFGHEAFADSISPVLVEFTFGMWSAELLFKSRNGQPVLTELRVFPTRPQRHSDEKTQGVDEIPEGGLRPRFVKDLAIGGMRDQAIQALTSPQHPIWEGRWPNPAEEWYDIAHYSGIESGALGDIPKKPGRRSLTDEELARVALYYVEALAEGRGTTKHVWNRLGQDGVYLSEGTVSGRIYKARLRGFLTPASTKGQKGGTLTPEAREILQRLRTEKEQQ